MARNKGTFNFAANFEVLNKAPLDARLVVDTKANLITPSIWEDDDTNVWIYKGITVSVVNDPSTVNNGLYFLTDDTTYTSYSSWVKVDSSGGSVGPIDSSGTSSLTWQLNNGDHGVILKDVSGNLEVVTFDGSTYSGIRTGNIYTDSLRIDTLNGALYAADGSVYASPGSFPLKAYQGFLIGNGSTQAFTVDHSLNTLKHTMTIFDGSNDMVYPDLQRGLNSDIITFNTAPLGGTNYEIIILGF